jgi:hypothetical protein
VTAYRNSINFLIKCGLDTAGSVSFSGGNDPLTKIGDEYFFKELKTISFSRSKISH